MSIYLTDAAQQEFAAEVKRILEIQPALVSCLPKADWRRSFSPHYSRVQLANNVGLREAHGVSAPGRITRRQCTATLGGVRPLPGIPPLQTESATSVETNYPGSASAVRRKTSAFARRSRAFRKVTRLRASS